MTEQTDIFVDERLHELMWFASGALRYEDENETLEHEDAVKAVECFHEMVATIQSLRDELRQQRDENERLREDNASLRGELELVSFPFKCGLTRAVETIDENRGPKCSSRWYSADRFIRLIEAERDKP